MICQVTVVFSVCVQCVCVQCVCVQCVCVFSVCVFSMCVFSVCVQCVCSVCVFSVCCVILLTLQATVCYRDKGPAEQLFTEMETKDATVYGSLIKGRAKVGRNLIPTTKHLGLISIN